MNRALGEGKIIRLSKRTGVIEDVWLGKVNFMLADANVQNNDCTNLLEKFSIDDTVIFTAKKLDDRDVINDVKYRAISIVKRSELITCNGRIVETFENSRFCYAEARKYGRIFVPNSAKIDVNSSTAWLGHGAAVQKSCTLKIFRQQDINSCRYVAFSITLTDKVNTAPLFRNLQQATAENQKMKKFPVSSGQLRGAENLGNICPDQIGVIVRFGNTDKDCLLYSSITGHACITRIQRKPWMELGRFAKYDCHKMNVVPKDEKEKVFWYAENITDLGFTYKLIHDPMDPQKLQLELNAVCNRVAYGNNRSAWLWNDFIGRIYVPLSAFNSNLKTLGSVRCKVVYTGAFEDVPWSALTIEIIDDESIRVANAQLLSTSDNWTMLPNQNFCPTKNLPTDRSPTFFGFMSHPTHGSAFCAWTDLNEIDTPPSPLTKCRVTVYYQQRDKKHALRAVLVTELDENNEPVLNHPMFSGSGRKIMPEPFVAPQPPAPPKLLSVTPPPGLAPLPANHWPVVGQSAAQAQAKAEELAAAQAILDAQEAEAKARLAQIKRVQSVGVIGSGLPSRNASGNGAIGSSNGTGSGPLSPSPSLSELHSPSVGELVSSSDTILNSVDSFDELPISATSNGIGLDTNFVAFSPWDLPWVTTGDDFLKWKPQPIVSTTHQSAMSSSTTNSTTKSSHVSNVSNMSHCTNGLLPSDGTLIDMNVPSFKAPQLSTKPTVDCGSQTDMMSSETSILREMMASREFRNVLMTKFPPFFDRIMDLQWGQGQ